MKLIFFGKVLCEGTPEECLQFKKNLLKKIHGLDEELRAIPVEKDSKVIFETLEFINPTAYETLSYIKELIGEYFIEYQFLRMSLPGVVVEVYEDLETKQKRGYFLGHILIIILQDEKGQTIWKVEE